MCELLGLNANIPTTIIRSFSSLAERGGNSGPHKDGWGITFYEGNKGCRTFKDSHPSCCSAVSSFIQNNPIHSPLIIAHIRQANRGEVNTQNTHPFSRELWGNCWTFAHNGQLDNNLFLDTGPFTPLGETDSESAFCWLLNQMKNKYPARPNSDKELFDFIAQKARYLNDNGIFNMLLSDGINLMAFCGSKLAWVKRQNPFDLVEYYEGQGSHNMSDIYDKNGEIILIATQPLTDENWQQLNINDYALLKEGRCINCE